MLTIPHTQYRHPELVSGSIGPQRRTYVWRATAPYRFHEVSGGAAKWILKQVQDDEFRKVLN